MSVLAEELASQAKQLQHTIAFFTIDERGQEKLGVHEHVTHRKTVEREQETNPTHDDTSPSEITRRGGIGDEQDEDFERY